MRIYNSHGGGLLIGTTTPFRADTKLNIQSTPFQIFTTMYSPQSEMIAHFRSSVLNGYYKNAEIMSFYSNEGGHFLRFQKIEHATNIATDLFQVSVDGRTFIGNSTSTGTMLTV